MFKLLLPLLLFSCASQADEVRLGVGITTTHALFKDSCHFSDEPRPLKSDLFGHNTYCNNDNDLLYVAYANGPVEIALSTFTNSYYRRTNAISIGFGDQYMRLMGVITHGYNDREAVGALKLGHKTHLSPAMMIRAPLGDVLGIGAIISRSLTITLDHKF